MEKNLITTADVWTDRFPNNKENISGAFIDGWVGGRPYDAVKAIKNCNCFYLVNGKTDTLRNKHNAIMFYKDKKCVRCAFLDDGTDLESQIKTALQQKVDDKTLLDIFDAHKIKIKTVDLKEKPIKNKYSADPDIASCDRYELLKCMLEGCYTEDKIGFQISGTWQNIKYNPNADIEIKLTTDEEIIDIKHNALIYTNIQGFGNRIIIIQNESGITRDMVSKELDLRFGEYEVADLSAVK